MRKITFLLVALLFMGMQVVQAQKVITGKVTSAEDGSSIPGVQILVKGTMHGTTTDIDGKYRLTVPEKSDILEFKFVGMKDQEIKIGSRNIIDVVMTTDVMNLDAVVVTAVGVKKEKKALGYAVQDVSGKEITRGANPNFATAIQGKIAGVEVRQSSGMPGASSQILIHGARFFDGNNSPLYVIDGMPVSSNPDFNVANGGVVGTDYSGRSIDIDPNDVESINVLKGQAAAALYGMRASNGVIIITTKSGKGNEKGSPILVNFSTNYSFDNISRLPERQTTWAQGINRAYKHTNSSSWGCKIDSMPYDPGYGYQSSFPGGTPGKYWNRQKGQWVTPQSYDNVADFFKTGYTNNNSVNLSQAGNFGNYSIGFGNTKQEGIVPGTDMTRYSAKVSTNFDINPKWKTGFSANYSDNKINKIPSGNSSILFTVYGSPSSYDLAGTAMNEQDLPYKQISYRTGAVGDNPYWAIEHNVFTEATKRFFGNTYFDFTPNNFMNVRYQLGIDQYSTDMEEVYEMGSAQTGGSTFTGVIPSPKDPAGGSITNKGVISSEINSLLNLTFKKEITPLINGTLLLGNEFYQNNQRFWQQDGTGFNIGGWHNLSNTTTQIATESKYKNRTVGFYGNLSFDYMRMLYLNITGRNDIVSSMPAGSRSFFYPSVSLSWVFTELDQFKNNSVLSFGKIRTSFAQVGQQGTYHSPYYVMYSVTNGFVDDGIQFPFNGLSSYSPNTTLYSPTLKPQNTKSIELGTELKFFKGRIGFEYNYTHQTTVDQIFAVPLAGSTGYAQEYRNAGQMTSQVHEIMLNIIPVKLKNFEWNLTVNFTKTVNTCDELAPGVESIYLGGFVDPQVRAYAGYSYPTIYGSRFERNAAGQILIDDDPTSTYYGMPIKSDVDGKIGDVTPKFIMGFNNSFKYKFVTLTALFDWKNGGQIYSGSNRLIDLYGVSIKTENRTTAKPFDFNGDQGVKASNGKPNDINIGGPGSLAYQTLYWDLLAGISEAQVYETSYLKLREIALTFDFPKKLLAPVGIKAASFTVFARNILLWTTLPNFDPETSQGAGNMQGGFDYMSLPQTRSFGVGLNLTF
ncbi:MAG: SusC/RagA family TonB-linked outer membrane protein [Bacteroidetes bacterium]|nr:SusC/RagA family TonB-linked outer membrane protein [Bacteroidota bacterium]